MGEVRVSDILNYLNQKASFQLQESYDNSGLITGNTDDIVKGILVTLDCTEAVISEAYQTNCNVIVAHHPILFKPLKSLTGKNYVERVIINSIRKNINIIAVHTNLDHVLHGVNKKIADKLGLQNIRILSPAPHSLLKLVTFVPKTHVVEVLNALHNSGAGNIGNYKNCSFQLEGTGSFMPTTKATPFLGTHNNLEQVEETRLELILPKYAKEPVLEALKKSHPYEEVAYYLSALENENQDGGAGLIGELEEKIPALEFIKRLKTTMQAGCIRFSPLVKETIKKIALCGGSGSFLLKKAIQEQSDIFISSDFKYHEFFDSDGQIIIADIGHYESEQFTKELLYEILKENFTTFAIVFSKVITNPISYL